ncbi:ABC transporter permease [Thermophilibacter provencensis]|uniref:ABC transporter permease n=1 Tax=Thermophilibacter provencensis TaxID=1852386 RepID=A0ABT7V3E7_9ACTN|nr:ABC transporter permease [Thermophilibacter provencensis]MDM8271123.1 ABC transporter permease [Thermophilibacter provencensis]
MSNDKNVKPADQAEEQEYSLNDDRRVKVLSPGALIAKRFFRNRLAVVGLVILVAMFLFSFVGGVISPYGQDETFSTMTELNTQYAGITETTSLRYTAAPDAEFGALVQSKANSAINAGETSFERDGVVYTIDQPTPDLYTFSQGGQVVAYASSNVVSVPAGATAPSFEFQVAAITAITAADEAEEPAADAPEVTEDGTVVVESDEGDAADAAAEAEAAGNTFEVDGATYSFDEAGNVMDGSGTVVAMVSPFVMSASDGNTVIPDDLRQALLTAIEADASEVVYTDANGAEHTYTISYDAYSKVYNVTETTENLVYDRYASPSLEHWLGTDGNGMDMLTRLMYGGRVSLIIGFIVVFIAAGLGVIMGGISGYFGGWVDNLIMRIVDVFYCLPSMPIIIILGSAMDAMRLDPWIRMIYLMLILGFLSWPGIARLVRGQILSLREQEFMLATEATGISVPHRIIRHLIPNVMPQLIVSCTMSLGSTIITEATLSFLGLGVKFPFASWGNIISDVNNAFVMTNYWFIWIPAGICLLLAVLGFNFVGDGLRDAFDPKMNR